MSLAPWRKGKGKRSKDNTWGFNAKLTRRTRVRTPALGPGSGSNEKETVTRTCEPPFKVLLILQLPS